MDSIISFIQNNTVIAIAIAVILLFLIYRKPKLFFGILFLGLFLALLYYLIMSLAGSGSKQEKRLFNEEENQSDTGRWSLFASTPCSYSQTLSWVLVTSSETVEKPFSMVNRWFSGVSSPLIIMRSLIVAHSVRSFFSASQPRICLRTFSTVSPVLCIFRFRLTIQHF